MDLEREIVMKILIVLVTLFVERTTAMVPVLENATTVAQIFDFYSKYQRTIFYWQLSSGFERIVCARHRCELSLQANNPTSIYIFLAVQDSSIGDIVSHYLIN